MPSLILQGDRAGIIKLRDWRGPGRGTQDWRGKMVVVGDIGGQERGRDWRKKGQWRWASNRDTRGTRNIGGTDVIRGLEVEEGF